MLLIGKVLGVDVKTELVLVEGNFFGNEIVGKILGDVVGKVESILLGDVVGKVEGIPLGYVVGKVTLG
jgi:hypothetical protein